MDGNHDPRAPERRIDAAAKTAFLAALRRGAPREDAAAKAGFSLTGFYGQRHRDPAFAADWAAALATRPAAERRARAYAERGRGELRIAPANRRRLQRRRRYVRFTAERQQLFLARLAATADSKAAAAAAGVAISTVTLHRRKRREFAESCQEALALAWPKLEADALHLALIAQARLRHALEQGFAAGLGRRPAPCPHCGHIPDEAETFDRIMRLLALRDRKERRVEQTFKPGGRRQAMTFAQAIGELERYFRGMGIPIVGEDQGRAGKEGGGEAHPH